MTNFITSELEAQDPQVRDHDPIPVPGDFTWLKMDHTMLNITYNAVTRLDLWGWLENYTPDPKKGYLFSWCQQIQSILIETNSIGHSGASFAYCMRHMEIIAKKGWGEYYEILKALTKN